MCFAVLARLIGLLQKSLEQRFSNERGRSYSVPPEEEKQRKERQD